MSPEKINRRTFAKAVVAGTAASVPLLAPPSAAGQEEEDREPTEAERLLEVVKQRYPADYTEEQLDEIRRDVAGHLGRSKTLSEFPLANSDEPAFVFAAYRGG